MKIQIIGYSGSGKSTFAQRLGELYHIPVLHIDTIHFAPNWVERDDKEMDMELHTFVCQDNWIIDGQYTKHVNERFDLCDQLFLFNFNRFKCLYGIIKRYFHYRCKERNSIAKGCIEKLDWSFIKWVLFEGRSHNIHVRNQMYIEKYHNKIIIFKKRKQVNLYLKKIGYKGSLKY